MPTIQIARFVLLGTLLFGLVWNHRGWGFISQIDGEGLVFVSFFGLFILSFTNFPLPLFALLPLILSYYLSETGIGDILNNIALSLSVFYFVFPSMWIIATVSLGMIFYEHAATPTLPTLIPQEEIINEVKCQAILWGGIP